MPDDTSELKRPRRSSVRGSLTAMNVATVRRSWLPPLIYLAHNPLTLLGLFFVNAAAVFWLFLLPVATQEGAQHPYLLIFFFGVLPIAFLIGITLIPLGIYLRYRRQSRKGLEAREFAPLGWDNREFRHVSIFILVATAGNVLVGGYFSQSTVHYMDSVGFCGTTCHSMNPEHVAVQNSPHLNIDCVECHIGSGRRAYAQAKLNGIWQVVVTVLNRFPKPISTPLENLRPAREICESCHWPASFAGVQIRVFNHFAADSANTHTRTVLALVVGGGPVASGIHGFHVAPGVTVEYVADETRQNVYWVRHTDPAGTVSEYVSEGWESSDRASHAVRQMDCLDCHTRPSHGFQMPARALDEAMALSKVDPTLPWVKRTGLEILRSGYAGTGEAEAAIPVALADFYRSSHPELFQSRRESIEHSAAGLVEIFKRNVFPEMGVDWGTYPDNSGHSDFIGCFRCHGGELRTAEGGSITTDCEACHRMLAVREEDPEILYQLGISR